MRACDLRFLRCLRFPLLLADPARYRRPETPARSLLWFGCGRSATLGASVVDFSCGPTVRPKVGGYFHRGPLGIFCHRGAARPRKLAAHRGVQETDATS